MVQFEGRSYGYFIGIVIFEKYCEEFTLDKRHEPESTQNRKSFLF
jgi:hypothetical protein